jgi:hypothetical protein
MWLYESHQVATCGGKMHCVNKQPIGQTGEYTAEETTSDFILTSKTSVFFHRPMKNACVATLLWIFSATEMFPNLFKCFQSWEYSSSCNNK